MSSSTSLTLLDEMIAVVEAAAMVSVVVEERQWNGGVVGDRVTVLAPLEMHGGNIVIAAKQQEGVKEEDVGVGARVVVLSLLPLLLWVLGAVIGIAGADMGAGVGESVGGGSAGHLHQHCGRQCSNVGPGAGPHDAGRRWLKGLGQHATGRRREEKGQGGKREEGGPGDVALMPFILVTSSLSLHRAQGKRREKGELGDVAGEGRQWCGVDDSRRTLVPSMMLWRSNIEVGDGEVEDVIVGMVTCCILHG
ncbi:hypothetical protein BDQ17DRAFT_1332547 [Cyathus striatus]|nr:hypothetical protein BDQ17DRAFT_1332547 [Cyathus striatus]